MTCRNYKDIRRKKNKIKMNPMCLNIVEAIFNIEDKKEKGRPLNKNKNNWKICREWIKEETNANRERR